jgi:hypothetical protein
LCRRWVVSSSLLVGKKHRSIIRLLKTRCIC